MKIGSLVILAAFTLGLSDSARADFAWLGPWTATTSGPSGTAHFNSTDPTATTTEADLGTYLSLVSGNAGVTFSRSFEISNLAPGETESFVLDYNFSARFPDSPGTITLSSLDLTSPGGQIVHLVNHQYDQNDANDFPSGPPPPYFVLDSSSFSLSFLPGTYTLSGHLDSTYSGFGSITYANETIRVRSVPEPSTFGLLAAGAALCGLVVRRRRRGG